MEGHAGDEEGTEEEKKQMRILEIICCQACPYQLRGPTGRRTCYHRESRAPNEALPSFGPPPRHCPLMEVPEDTWRLLGKGEVLREDDEVWDATDNEWWQVPPEGVDMEVPSDEVYRRRLIP